MRVTQVASLTTQHASSSSSSRRHRRPRADPRLHSVSAVTSDGDALALASPPRPRWKRNCQSRGASHAGCASTATSSTQEETMNTDQQNGFQATVVLVHGAFAESASWNEVIRRLQDNGDTALAAAIPIRSLTDDTAFVASILASIERPIVTVDYSYGDAVTTNAALGNDNVKALVFVAAFAPEEGESIGELSGRSPGSTLGDKLSTVPLSDGSTDHYIRQEEYHQQFAVDVPAEQAALMAATQRPLRDVALNEGSGAPAWKSIPSWFVFP